MDSKIQKTIRKNTAGVGAGRKKKLCPLCILRLEETTMVFDHELKQYKCNACLYIAPKHMGPVNESVVEAGNAEESIKPHISTVKMHKKPLFKTRITEFYDSPSDAWKSDDM